MNQRGKRHDRMTHFTDTQTLLLHNSLRATAPFFEADRRSVVRETPILTRKTRVHLGRESVNRPELIMVRTGGRTF